MANEIIAPIELNRVNIVAPIELNRVNIVAPIELAADAYQLAIRDGFVGTRLEWIESLKGISAYQSYLNTTLDNPPLSEAAWSSPNSDTGYEHLQLSPNIVWDIVHSLNKYPSVTVTDSAGTVVIGQVQYLSSNHLIVSFSAAFSGVAYLN